MEQKNEKQGRGMPMWKKVLITIIVAVATAVSKELHND